MSSPAAAPSLPSLLLGHWQPAWGPDVAATLSVVLYAWGAIRVGRRWSAWRTASFLAGTAVLLVALQSGLDAYDDRLLSAHMLQHVLLVMVAPALLLLGAPVMLALKAAPPRQRRSLARVLARTRALTRPGICLAVFTIVLVGLHAPPVFDAAVHRPLLHELEHAAFLAAGLALWWPLTSADPVVRHRLGGLGRVFYMLAAMVPEDLVGAYLNRAGNVVYAAYLSPARAVGISAIADQQRAGAIMWVGASCIMAAGGLCAAMAAMIAEERRVARREAHATIATAALSEIATPRGPA